ncbi:hypothetical protein [Microbacterium sp. NPDC058345]|uniref:hypothetical protein n=1 Tax=Microbacterium sp. NPDC058345 TaxID=3346455 RepID=UPI0036626B5F
MSTSDQDGNGQLTRKQLRELRLTGSTPVISDEEATTAAQAAPVPPRAAEPAVAEPAVAEPAVAEPAPEQVPVDAAGVPLTRRQARAQERTRTASAPSPEQPAEGDDDDAAQSGPQEDPPVAETPEAAASDAEEHEFAPEEEAAIVSEVPRFDPAPADDAAVAASPDLDAAPAEDAEFEPVTDEAAPVVEVPINEQDAAEQDAADADTADEVLSGTDEVIVEDADVAEPAVDDVAPRGAAAATETAPERPMVGAAFGLGVKTADSAQSFPPLFDAILEGDSTGSHHTAPSALIFTHAPGVGSLSGPVASTGELLITGTYELPEGLGSRGHALGVADGKDIDAVLIDGELAPASSPTPIAASSAVSTSKPAGEVIRPPAPEKGNKLMLTLAVVAGGLALALATVLIIAFTTNLFG